MKSAFRLLLGAAALVFQAPAVKASGPAICDPQQSSLCSGLGVVFAFEENSDNPRWDENRGAAFLEADGQNVARAAGKIDSYAASFTGTDGNYLYIPRGGALGASFTVAAWVFPTSASTEQIVVSMDEATKHGPFLALVPSSGNVKLKGVAYYGDGQGDVSVTSASSMTLNTWHLVVWGIAVNTSGQVTYVEVDNGNRDTVSITYWLASSSNDLILGQRKGSGAAYTMPYSGRVDQLAFAGRYWDTTETAEFYNAGSGKAYPFVPSSFNSLNDGLVAYWKFDEAVTSGTRYDSVNQNNATDTGGAYGYGTGVIGNAAYSDYSPAYEDLQVATNSTIEYSGDFTVGGWFKTSDVVSQQAIAEKGLYGSSFEWVVMLHNPTNTSFQVGNCTTAASGAISANTWYFLVADYTASTKTCRVRLNNGTVYSGTGTTLPVVTSYAMSFTTGYSSGYRDEWFLYKRVLTSQQMTDLYNSGTGRTYPF